MPGVMVSTVRQATMASPAASAAHRCQLLSRTKKMTVTTTPQTTEGACRKDISVNEQIPISDPIRSHR